MISLRQSWPFFTKFKMFPKDFLVIKCISKGRLRSKEDIHEEIWEKVKDKLGL